jgi:hypothetical protein
MRVIDCWAKRTAVAMLFGHKRTKKKAAEESAANIVLRL